MAYDFIPICYVSDKKLLTYRRSNFFIYDITTDELSFFLEFRDCSFMSKLASKAKLTARLFRQVNMIGCNIDNDNVIFAYNSKVYRIFLETKEISLLFPLNKGKRPLSFCNIESNFFIKEGVYYGDYCSNPNKDEIKIYRIDKTTYKKEIVYTFPKGEVNHIHHILYDEYNKCLWIFSGDFGDAAAIWKVEADFKKVTPILRGKQKYRSCVATCYNGNVIYATDTPFQKNTLRILKEVNSDQWESEEIENLPGSVIYGTRKKNFFIFSTSVEPNGVYKNKMEMLFSRRKGDGIVDKYMHLYKYDLENKILKEEYFQKKDLFPYVTFQFGALIFPSGDGTQNICPTYHIASKEFDLETKFIKI